VFLSRLISASRCMLLAVEAGTVPMSETVIFQRFAP
jgi:hypothetical protein